jgi:hypothetical protein
VIPGAVIHMQNEQPLLADLERMPEPIDVALVRTNRRYLNGRKPPWTDHIDSWFLMPLAIIGFVEVPRAALEPQEPGIVPPHPGALPPTVPDDLDEEVDEDLLRRIREGLMPSGSPRARVRAGPSGPSGTARTRC